jgi:hypothetical protein
MDFVENLENEKLPSTTTLTTSSAPNPNVNPLLDVEIKDENVSLNLLVSFLTLANKRGAFSLEEAHKIWECVKRFK